MLFEIRTVMSSLAYMVAEVKKHMGIKNLNVLEAKAMLDGIKKVTMGRGRLS